MKIDKIMFYYPSRITGGAEYLFKRCAEYLAENQEEYQILYADYPDGFVRKNILSKKVIFVEVGFDREVKVEDGTAVIVQLNIISQLSLINYNRQRSLCLFWSLHSLNIKSQIYARGRYWISRKSRKLLGGGLARLTGMNVVKFMNYSGCFSVFSDLCQTPEEFEWLPNVAPIRSSAPPDKIGRVSDKEWKFCWLGRLDSEKSRNVETYMNELEELNKTTPVSLSLIGRGPNENYLKGISTRYSYPISFVGEKREAELDRYIREETEIGLASGTSAFEFALRGKPVIMEWVIDRVYPAGERTTYIFTHEDEIYDYSVANRLVRVNESDFMKKAEAIFDDYAAIVQKEYDYVLSKSVQNCTKKLIKTINQISALDCEEVEKECRIVGRLINKGRWRISTIYNIVHPFKYLYNCISHNS